MAEIVQHPSAPQPSPVNPQPTPLSFDIEDYVSIEWADDVEEVARELIAMLKHEIGLRWMSFALKIQIEKLELLIGDSGTQPGDDANP